MSYLMLRYGSSARGDTTKDSDEDFLCIYQNEFDDFLSLKKRFSGVNFYSVDEIYRMRGSGSLFLTHLDIDSVYIEGDEGLRSSFEDFRPSVVDLISNVDKSFDSLSEIKWCPDNNEGQLWLSDICYVFLRNIIYSLNAMNGKYLFGYKDAVFELFQNAKDIDCMIRLRQDKYSFRGDKNKASVSIFEIERVITSIAGKNIKFNFGGVSDFFCIKNNYLGNRFLERAILNKEIEDDFEFMKKIKDINYNKSNLMQINKKIIKSKIN